MKVEVMLTEKDREKLRQASERLRQAFITAGTSASRATERIKKLLNASAKRLPRGTKV